MPDDSSKNKSAGQGQEQRKSQDQRKGQRQGLGQGQGLGGRNRFGRVGWIYVFLLLMLLFFYVTGDRTGGGMFGSVPEIEYSEFRSQLRAGNVERVHVKGDEVRGELAQSQVFLAQQGDSTAYDRFRTVIPSFGDEGLLALMEEQGVVVSAEPEGDGFWWYLLVFAGPLILLILFGYVFLQRMQGAGGRGMMNIGQSQAHLQRPEDNKTTFEMVAGLDGAKAELREVIEFLKNPDHFKDLGATLPKGILLLGPPGTGKTLLARAVAGEAGVPFFTITGSDFMEMFVGVGAKRVREMFKKAKEMAPSIIFVDEIDSIGRTRGAGVGGGHDEREQTLNQLLSELDGFEPTENIVVMAATNRPDILDKALLRPGRFDRQVTVDLPSQEARVEILKIHAKKKPLDESVDLDALARSTPGFSGADLANLLNEAALYAGRAERKIILPEDIEMARDKVVMGLEREGMRIDDQERELLAYHEAGHALVAAVLQHADPVHKVTIIPRGMAMGVTQQLPVKEKYLYNKEMLMDQLAVIMGGRAAEQEVFGTSTSGAENDLQRVAKLARKMVMDWGMSDAFHHMAFQHSQEEVFLGREITRQQEYSDATAREMDKEVEKISHAAFDRAVDVLASNRNALDRIAALLLEKDQVSGEEVEQAVREGKAQNGKAQVEKAQKGNKQEGESG